MRCPGRSPFFKGEGFKFGVQVFHSPNAIWVFPKTGVPFWGVPIIRMIVFWGLYWGPPYLWKLPDAVLFRASANGLKNEKQPRVVCQLLAHSLPSLG